MSDKYTTARLTKGQDHFEILVKPQPALDYKLGKQVPISQVLLIEEVYSDSSKGTRASEEKPKLVLEELRPILPIKLEQMRIAVKVFPEHAARAYNAFKSFGTVSREEWQSDGSLMAVIEMPAGMYGSFIDRVGKLTQGTIQTKVLT